MNELQVFNNEMFGEIRVLEIEGEPWFVGKDVAIILGYAKPQNAISTHVDEDDTLKQGIIDSLGRNQQTTIINESGLYSLILSSKLPNAKQFKRWVTNEVLPSIRKYGNYSIGNNVPMMIEEVDKLVNMVKEQQTQIDELKSLVGIRAKDTFNYSKFIKDYLGISIVNADYRAIREMFFVELGVSKWEDIAYSRENVVRLKEICETYYTNPQISFFEDEDNED